MSYRDIDAELLAKIGRRIKRRREDAGLTQEQLALKSGVSRNMLSKLENGNYNITALKLWSIARTLDVNVGQLFPKVKKKAKSLSND